MYRYPFFAWLAVLLVATKVTSALLRRWRRGNIRGE